MSDEQKPISALLKAIITNIKKRIKILETSKGDWAVLKEYEKEPIGSDSEYYKKIQQEKKKSTEKKYRKIQISRTMALRCHFPFSIFFTSLQNFFTFLQQFFTSLQQFFKFPFRVSFLLPYTIYFISLQSFLLLLSTIFFTPLQCFFTSLQHF